MAVISRRTFLRLSTGALAPTGAGSLGLLGADTGATSAGARAISRGGHGANITLKELDGRLVLPAEAKYATSRLVYNLRFADEKPVAVAYCASSNDAPECGVR
jgi:hypothetical protein